MNLHKNISNLSFHISTHSKELTSMEKAMVQELLKQRVSFTYKSFTIANISEQLNVSSTSLHRLSKKLGYESFTLFKEDYFEKNPLFSEGNKQDDYVTMITNTYQMVEEAITPAMIETMLKAKKITIYGMGMSSYIGKIFQIKMQMIGISTQQYDDSRFMRLSSRSLKKNEDMIIILSRTGSPPELVEVMAEANRLGIESILISETVSSPLESMATYVLYTSCAQDLDNNVDTRINTHIAMDVLMKQFMSQIEKRK